MSEIIPKQLGAVRDLPDERDYQGVDVMDATPPNMPSFQQGYDVEGVFGALPDNDQGSAYDCVCEGGTEDINMTIKVFCGENKYLSPRDAYSQIHLPNGAASPRDFYKLADKVGVCEDRFLPTRPNGQKLTEEFARKRDDLLSGAVYWKIGAYYSISSNNIQAIVQAVFTNNGCGGAYFPQNSAMGHFIFFRGYGIFKGCQALKYRDTYEPYTKWIYLKGGNYFLQDGTPIELAGIWTCGAGEWTPYKKKEITCEMIRYAWLKRNDLKKVYPFSTKFYNIDGSQDNIYLWAQKYLYAEMPELFSGEIDWSDVDLNLYSEYKFIEIETPQKTLIEKILLWFRLLFHF